MTDQTNALPISPQAARVIQAQLDVATSRANLGFGVAVAGVVSLLFTVVVLGIVWTGVKAAIEYSDPIPLLSLLLLLVLAIPYFALFNAVRVFRAIR